VFDGLTATPDSKIVALEAPIRAEDASLVPMTITLGGDRIKELYLIIDDNPRPSPPISFSDRPAIPTW